MVNEFDAWAQWRVGGVIASAPEASQALLGMVEAPASEASAPEAAWEVLGSTGQGVNSVGASSCCFHIGPVMETLQANLWPDTLQSPAMPARLPSSPGRNYNVLVVGFDWEVMKYRPSAVTGNAGHNINEARG